MCEKPFTPLLADSASRSLLYRTEAARTHVCMEISVLRANLATLEEEKRLQMLGTGEFKSSPAMRNPTLETPFLWAGKLIALQL